MYEHIWKDSVLIHKRLDEKGMYIFADRQEAIVKFFSGMTITILSLLISAQFCLAQSDTITVNNESPMVKDTITFTYNYAGPPPTSPCIWWDFGDGSKKARGKFVTTMEHTYKEAGTYTVRAWKLCDDAGAPTATMEITVGGAKSITHQPRRPRAGQKVTFTAVNFVSDKCIRWDFGDRTPRVKDKNPPNIFHSYAKNGRYTVRAYDECGSKDPITKKVTVGGDTRRASYLPSNPVTGERVTIRTSGNYSSCMLYDFGDGTRKSGKSMITHVYRKPGTYLVKIYAYCGDDANPQMLQIPVVNGFTIDRVDLKFKDGALPSEDRFKELVPNVEKNTKKLRAEARINYSGKGTITMQWLVDNKVMQMITKPVLRFNGQLELGTGVDLPTHTLGPHTVTVRFLSPDNVEFRIPVLKYFVSPETQEVPGAADENAQIILKGCLNEQGEPVSMTDPLQLIPGEYGIFEGVIENIGDENLQKCRLQVSLDGSLIDSQLLLNIPAGGEKSFNVSLQMVEKETMLEFVVVDHAGDIVVAKSLMVQPAN